MSLKPKMPKAAAAPNVPPPVQVMAEQSPSIQEARRRAMRAAASRRGFAKTVRAGETRSNDYQSSVGQRSLLGVN